MDGYICTRQKCKCGGRFVFDRGRRDLFCNQCDARTTGTYTVRLHTHHKSFRRNIEAAIQHLDYVRSQRGRPDVYGRYDPKDWQKHNPHGISALGIAWIKKKGATKPPLTDTRMGMIRNSIKRLVDMFGDVNVKTLSDLELDQFYTAEHYQLDRHGEYTDKLIGSKTLFDICTTLNEFLRWAAKRVKVEPIQFTELGYDYHETEPITIQDQMSIIEWIANNCPEPKIVFAINTLCRNPNVRPGEIIEVRWKHIDLISGIIYIHKRKSRRKLKRRALVPKKIFVTQAQLEYLKEIREDDLTKYLFTYTVKRSGVTPGNRIHKKVLNIWFKKAGAALGIDTYLYAGTKHTTTTELCREFDRRAVMQDGTGHRTDDAFNHYDHSDGTRKALEMRKAWDRMRDKIKAVK